MRNLIILKLLILVVTSAFSATWNITNSGSTFTPNTITITLGDEVVFTLSSEHNVVEVSQTTWDANSATPLSGGFQLGFGGGTVQSAQLSVGTHYYVCSPHASMGMKGMIVVENVTSIDNNRLLKGFSVFPNPSNGIISIRVDKDDIGSSYQINDLIGREVLYGILSAEATQVDISNLNSGTYLVRIVGVTRRTLKIIKN